MTPYNLAPIHANTAAVAQLHPKCADVMRESISQLAETAFYGRHYSKLSQASERFRSAVARLLGGTEQDRLEERIAIANSTSDGLATVLDALRESQPPGGVAVFNRHSFVSVPLSLKRLKSRDMDVVEAGAADGRLEPHHLAKLGNVRLVVVDWVNYRTGTRNSIQPLAEHCDRWGITLVVDAIQGLGAAPLDFDLELVDALACGGHKWLRGPEGTGFLYVGRQLLSQLTPRRIGYRSLRDPSQFDNPTQWVLSRQARMLEVGTLNTLGLLGAAAAIEALLERGAARTAMEIQRNTARMHAVLRQVPETTVVTPVRSDHSAGIVSFRHARRTAPDLVMLLRSVEVTAGVRGDLVRLSPASDAPIDELCRRLKAVLL